MNRSVFFALCLLTAVAAENLSRATETENLDLQVLPVPGKVVVDGKVDDWDLSGSIFACGDVENSAASFAVWFAAMYDRDNLYLLARWVDPTPMNHPGSIKGDYGFVGDCLQVRIVTAADVTAKEVTTTDQNADDAPKVRTSHLTCWRDRDKLDLIDVAYGRRFSEGGLKDAKKEGAAQAFLEAADGKGYTQEIAIPWKLLTKPGVEMKTGMRVLMTLEPNFTVGTGGRLTIKDLFKSGASIDRIFTFQGNGGWGYGTLEAKGKVPLRSVRLSDRREFPVSLVNGLPVVNWQGLTKSALPEGFKSIKFTLPEDGYVSLNVFAPDGTVARQLLTCQFLPKGEQEIQWDGLTTMSFHKPGSVVPAGEYTWQGIYHHGIGLRLRGWAANSGSSPWRGFGADHGNPIACTAAGDKVYLGWGGGEGDKPLQACTLDGEVVWKNIRGGIASAGPVAVDETTVYAFNQIKQYALAAIYRVDAKTGGYTEWSDLKSTDMTMEHLWGGAKDAPEGPSGLAAAGGRVFVSFSDKDAVVIVDAASGRVLKRLAVPKPSDIEAAGAKECFVVSAGREVVAVNVETGQVRRAASPALDGKNWISALALDKAGNLYLGIRGDAHHVETFSADGKLLRTIGRMGGRALSGPWTMDGMFNINGMAVDSQGKLWVAEDDGSPRRVSVWDTQTGKCVQELFGASSYGAIGACIHPKDPYLMVGQGCEWRIDPKTGRSVCLGTITRDGMGAARFGFGPNGRLYLAVASGFLSGPCPIRIFERLGDAQYKLRTMIRQVEMDGPESGKKVAKVQIWSDANDDQREQPDEVKTYDQNLGGWFAGWYMPMTPDMAFYGSLYQVKATGWTSCGAPQYDLAAARKLPGPDNAAYRGGMGAQHGHGSVDGRQMLWNACYGEDHSTMDCYDIGSGRLLWTYPSNFTGVHGSHRACSAQTGMLRGAYDITGSAKLPDPVGNIWVVPTNKGEWHVLTEKGFYLTKLFEGDPMKNNWPPAPVLPGANLDQCPPGAGEEAFGGSITQGVDGKLSVQAGHTSFWNAEVVGLETIKALPGGKVPFGGDDLRLAQSFRDRYLFAATTAKRLAAKRTTPAFSGDLEKDFAGAEAVKYQKDDATQCRTAIAYDASNLYVAWEVKDSTPWINGADATEFLYARGDTVDLQLGADPAAAKDRKEAVLGDMRISIGPYQGKPTVVVYRKEAKEKHPKVFNSGVVKGYQMASVVVLKDARVEVKVDPAGNRYVVEAALPLAALGLPLKEGLVLRGDVGVTYSDKEGRDTVVRTYWSNQNTGLVSDEVYELQMAPAAWGEIEFK